MKYFLAVLFLGINILSVEASTLISTNSNWKYIKGRAEASTPAAAWRTNNFNDSAWTTSQAPFYYENQPTSATAYTGHTALTDMDGSYTCIFMRQHFVIDDPTQIQLLKLTALSDDGFIAWINGTEVARFNMPAGNVAYNGVSLAALNEPVPFQNDTLTNFQKYLVPGTNILAIQAFNTSLSTSSDFIIFAGLTNVTDSPWTNIGISEFMATNKTTVQDVDGDASPWIEIYNPTATNISLTGWSLTADTNNLRQWVFPNITITPGDYIVLFASGKNRTNNLAELHTNFRLPVGGGSLALVNAKTNLVSIFTNYPAQLVDVSYGRDAVLPNRVGFFSVPTPDDVNTLGGAPYSAPDVVFSRVGGTFLSTFNLLLSTSSNAVIHVTLDGTPPSEDSPTYTNVAGLVITNSVQVRARAFLPGVLPSALHSESYLLLDPSLVHTNSNLPALVLYNFGAGTVPTSIDQFANASIYEPVNGVVSLTNAPTLNVRSGIHLHGSSTLNLPKHAFSLEFWDELSNDNDLTPLGLPSESDWILYAPDNFEPVLMHNPLIYQLSNDVGQYASRTRFVEVYINLTGGALTAANYNGIYVFEEKIKWDASRVNIKKTHSVDELHPLDNTTNVSGGYMMRIDRLGPGETGFFGAGQTVVYNYPSEADIKTPQRLPQAQYLQTEMNSFSNALFGSNYTNPTNGFRGVIDTSSWIDCHILDVAAFNVDAIRLSGYFYKDRFGKLEYGPIWDFDRSQGSTDGRDFNPRIWRADTQDLGTDFFNILWWGTMFTDIDFWQQWIDRYETLRLGALSTNHIFATIDSLAAQVQQEEPREAARWPGFTSPRSGTFTTDSYSHTFPGTYAGEVAFLKQWYGDRLNFMDTNFLALPVFSNNTGAFLINGTLAIGAPNPGTIYYTTDNTDPRLPGGAVSASAQIYTAPIALTPNVIITARVFNPVHRNVTGINNPPLSSPWSGPTTSAFVLASEPVITQSPSNLDAYLGQTPTFTVQTTGSPSPGYQWSFNGVPIVGQTNAQLTVSLTQSNQAGVYSVTVTNLVGTNSASFVLNLTPKPNLVVTEALANEAKGPDSATSDWWELSNLGSFPVNLQGFRFDDDHDLLSDAQVLTNAVSIAPGESIVLVEDLTPDQFRAWWGETNLPPHLQILTYPSIGFSSGGDAIHLWNAAAVADSDTVADATFPAATKGVAFGYDYATGVFGALSVPGQNGAFVAAQNGDIGSPGTIIKLPGISHLDFSATNGFGFNFATQPNLNYQVQYKNSLASTNWMILTNFTALGNAFSLMDPAAMTNETRYYRIVVLP